MQDKLTKIFQKAKYGQDSNLEETVWSSIAASERRGAKLRLWIFSLLGLVSLGGLVPAVSVLLNNLTQSGFYEYFSLIFSDSGAVLASWKEFIFSLAESLPLLSIIYTLSLIFVFFLSLRYAMKQVGKNQLISSLTFS